MKTKVTGIRLTEREREQLRKIGDGSLSAAIKRAIELLLNQNQVKPAS